MEGEDVGDLPCDAMEDIRTYISEDDILNIAVYHPKRRDLMDSIQFINERVGFRVCEGEIDLPEPSFNLCGRFNLRRSSPQDSKFLL